MDDMSNQAKAIFLAASEEHAPEHWPAFLDEACASNAALRIEVEKLLQARAELGSFHEAGPPTLNATVDVPRHERAGAVIGPYKLLQSIGEGGMGSVWMAEQTEPVRRQVALKVVKAGMDTGQVLARFEAERQALALMDHPNIARVLDAGSTPTGRPYFVMELVKGEPITKYCDNHKLPPRARLVLFADVCRAVQHAHQKGVIHRDLKPSNVLVAPYDGKPVIKVIDFGVAKATGQPLTEKTLFTAFGAIVGTPEYMSPEQAELNNQDIDTRSDLYSLGVLLYELLTGSTPLTHKRAKGAALLEVLRLVREEEPPRPSDRLSTAQELPSIAAVRGTEPAKLSRLVRGELDWIVMKALEKDRNRRYETANGLAIDVGRFLVDEPVQACPPSAGYRLRKFVRRNKGPVLAAGLVFSVLVAGLAGTSFGLLRAQQARQTAEEKEQVAVKAAEEERQAKLREIAQLAIAVEQRAKAEKARDRTRDVLDAMTSEITDDSLATQKAITEEQKQFLAEVLTYYKEFAGEDSDDERSRYRTARAAYKVGTIEYRLGRLEESVTAFRMARDLYAALAAEFPAAPAYRKNLAMSHNSLGLLLEVLGKRAEAEGEYRQALAIQEKLAAAFPAMPAYRQDLANSHYSLGSLLEVLGKRAEAEGEYRQALAIQEKLAAAFPAVPAYRQALAGSHNSLGFLLADLGKRAEAEGEYRQALAIQEKLAAAFPAMPAYRQDLAWSRHNLGSLLEVLGKRAEAEGEYRQALAIQEKLAADFRAVPACRQALANSRNSLGILLAGLGKRAEAEAEFRQALAIQEKLAADFRAVPAYRFDLAQSHNNLGALLAGLGKRAEAGVENRQALAIKEKLAADFPTVPAYQVDLGGSYCNCGNLLLDENRPTESVKWFDRAIRTLKPVHDREPRGVTAKQFLRNSHRGRAVSYDRLQKPVEAVKDWDRAIALSLPAEQLRLRANRASARLQAGSVAEAVAEVAELTKRPNWGADEWYDFACLYAVASTKAADKKQEYADRAMEMLHKAVKAGYKDAAHMAKDTDLDPLRDRADFKKLIGELKKKAAPSDDGPR